MIFRILKWTALLTLLLAVGTPLLLFGAAVERQPLITPQQHALTQTNVSRIKQLLKEANPRYLRFGEGRRVRINEADANLILSYAMDQLVDGAARMTLESNQASVAVSIALQPFLGNGYHFNASFDFVQLDNHFTIEKLRFGTLQLPDYLTRLLVDHSHRLLLHHEPYRVALDSIEELSLDAQHMELAYHWHQDLKDQVQRTGKNLLFKKDEQRRLVYYHEQILKAVHKFRMQTSLSELLNVLFTQAAQRSATPGQAVNENRSLILALTFYLLRMDIGKFIAIPTHRLNVFWPRLPTLARRHDLAQHFGVSAGITAAAGTRIAGAAGLFKELKDSQGGSGFSFADLAADLAGSRFTEIALDHNSAQALQQIMAQGDESQFMPRITDLPEGLQQAEFTQRYANLDNERYRLALAEIERRINERAIYNINVKQ